MGLAVVSDNLKFDVYLIQPYRGRGDSKEVPATNRNNNESKGGTGRK